MHVTCISVDLQGIDGADGKNGETGPIGPVVSFGNVK